jgi:hypothetical protein
MECPVRDELAASLERAERHYASERGRYLGDVSRATTEKYQLLFAAATNPKEEFDRAVGLLEAHTRRHGCRVGDL